MMKESQSKDNIAIRWDVSLNKKHLAYSFFPKLVRNALPRRFGAPGLPELNTSQQLQRSASLPESLPRIILTKQTLWMQQRMSPFSFSRTAGAPRGWIYHDNSPCPTPLGVLV